jgi:hypothetical protein
MSWHMVNGKPIEIADSPTVTKSGSLVWNVRDILFKDYPVCDPPTSQSLMPSPSPDSGDCDAS